MPKPQIKMGVTLTDYHQVRMDESVCLSPYATVIGDVRIGDGSSVFAGSQIRGDCAPIRVGKDTNIQENCCLHVSVDCPLTVGDRVTVGHNAVLHGCTIADNVLVGMGSVVMDEVEIGSDCIVGAGSLITQRKKFPPRTLIMGSPARAVRELTDEEIEAAVTVAAPAYAEVARAMLADGLMQHPSATATIWPE